MIEHTSRVLALQAHEDSFIYDQKDTTSGSTGTTWTYEYDCGGNILTKKRYAYTTGSLGSVLATVNYSYGDSNWKDKLTAYNGTSLSYDTIGNLTGDGTWSYTWQAGRQLKQMSKSGTTVVFDYDMGGMRASKTVGSSVTNYTYSGTNLTHMTKGADVMHFFYDGQGRPAIVKYNSAYYSYLYDLQGDVIGLVDSTGALVVEYKYDAWGKPLSNLALSCYNLFVHYLVKATGKFPISYLIFDFWNVKSHICPDNLCL